MADPFVAEIRIFGGNFAPKDGLSVVTFTHFAKYSSLFTAGNQLCGRWCIHFCLTRFTRPRPNVLGQGPGLSDRFIGEVRRRVLRYIADE